MKVKVYVFVSLCLLLAGTIPIQATRPPERVSLSVRNQSLPSIPKQSSRLATQASPDESSARLVKGYGMLPLTLEANRGQTDQIHKE